jgi:elongation factor P--(R)-beta-lysine ligase
MRERPSLNSIFPENFSHTLRRRHTIIKKIRKYFDSQGYTEVETPIRVTCPCIDHYIDAFDAGAGFYLSCSPELHMKRLLTLDLDCIYQITHSFRSEEQGPHHCSEFTMLEWYRKNTDYLGIMEETENLVKYLVRDDQGETGNWKFPFKRVTIEDLYVHNTGWNPCNNWDEDRYFRDWVEIIEPYLSAFQGVFVFDFPLPLASLSKTKHDLNTLCERFELFMHGLEIGNAYSELTDYNEHIQRFEKTKEKRKSMNKKYYIPDKSFLDSIKNGLPECGGIAIGVDRLIMALLGIPHIDLVQTFPIRRI